MNRKQLAELIVTVLYVGKIKVAPGTFGSLTAFPLFYIIVYFVFNNKIVFAINNLNYVEQQIITIFLINASVIIILFIIGIYYANIYIEGNESKDPKEIVIDETVGQLLTILLSSFSIFIIFNSKINLYISDAWLYFILSSIMPFLLFRLFDILKPWPINWLDQKIVGAFGIMIDDIAAAIFAVVAQYVMVFLIIDFLKTYG